MKLKETADFQRVMNTQKNRKAKEKRKKRKREWKENNPKPQSAMDVVKAVSEKRRQNKAAVPTEVHSKWEISSDGYYPYCKRCKARPSEMTKYCPECGARMDGD